VRECVRAAGFVVSSAGLVFIHPLLIQRAVVCRVPCLFPVLCCSCSCSCSCCSVLVRFLFGSAATAGLDGGGLWFVVATPAAALHIH